MTNLSRRQMLQTIGAAGIGTGIAVGTASGGEPKLPSCEEECDGSNILAKYNWEGQKFKFDEGYCDAFQFNDGKEDEGEEGGLLTNDEGEPFGVGFTSSLYYEKVIVKTGGMNGGTCYVFDRVDDDVMEDPVEKPKEDKDGHYTGWINVWDKNEEEQHAITYIAFCAAACFQVDFVFGDSIEDLGNEDEGGFYGKRKILHLWGNTATGRLSGTQATTKTHDGCEVTVTSQGIEVDDGKAFVEFTVDNGNDCHLTLASYSAPCPIGFTKETGRFQFRHAAQSGEFDEGGEIHRLEVELPTDPESLKAVCPDRKGNQV